MIFTNPKMNVVLALLLFFVYSVHAQNSNDLIIESLPENLPDRLSLTLLYSGETFSIELEKNRVFGENTRFLVDDGSGKLIEIDKGSECTYQGRVFEHDDYSVNAVLTNNGLEASIDRPNKDVIEIRPSGFDRRSHRVFTSTPEVQSLTKSASVSGLSIEKNTEIASDIQVASPDEISEKASMVVLSSNERSSANEADHISTATLPPTKVMKVFEFEVGIEIGSKAFFASSAYNGDLDIAKAKAQTLAGNLNSRYLHGAGVKHVLGTIIIRTNAATDPNRETVISTGSTASLSAFRDYWNNHPEVVGNTHDLAIYHILCAPSGLAWVNSVGTSNRYASVGGNGPDSWANGTAVHEFGHSWNLHHVNDSGLFYESKPRNNAGSTTSGGDDVFVSVMHGGGSHNIGRLATGEAATVLATKERKLSFGVLNTDPGQVKPFGVYDQVTITSSKTPILIDVIENDYDCNNDVLDARLLDVVSQKGAKISLSEGTGPGGRNQILYTPSTTVSSIDKDFFHYTVVDTAGNTDFCAVYVDYNTTSVGSTKLQTRVNVYPNPVRDILNLNIQGNDIVKNTLVVIYNNMGKTITELRISARDNAIDLSWLQPGVYHLQVIEDNIGIENVSIIKL